MSKKVGKKLVIGVMTSAMLLFGASSVYAYDGWADSLADAYSLNGPLNGVTTTINSSVDVDWYKWTNDTGRSVALEARLQSPAGKNYDLNVMFYFNGSTGAISSASDNGPGGLDSFGISTVNPGETVYYQVRGQTGKDYSTTLPYSFYLTII
ncbi:hypothetical protein H8B09_17435 [Paenibacillus sp. PR3]|uniref:Uncharacterized protein n=1 Tax=Paenibacillus terricola TaxID=2763503 RepID=A0ABR8N019_9BACL|nr:hypothetical protein [Paenibacillus terricola]MBD3920550.1 hypothetical protein [Paenibacillus terricola]